MSLLSPPHCLALGGGDVLVASLTGSPDGPDLSPCWDRNTTQTEHADLSPVPESPLQRAPAVGVMAAQRLDSDSSAGLHVSPYPAAWCRAGAGGRGLPELFLHPETPVAVFSHLENGIASLEMGMDLWIWECLPEQWDASLKMEVHF